MKTLLAVLFMAGSLAAQTIDGGNVIGAVRWAKGLKGVTTSGVVKVTSGVPSVITGTASDCIKVDGSTGACLANVAVEGMSCTAGTCTLDGSLIATLSDDNIFTGNNQFGMGSTGYVAASVTNDTSTGTVQYRLAKIDSAAHAVRSATADTSFFGIVVAGAGTTGSATVVTHGRAECTFVGAVTIGHTAKLSTDGQCEDAGATLPVGPQLVGTIMTGVVGGRATVFVNPFRREAGDATSLQSILIDTATPNNNDALTYNSGTGKWAPAPISGASAHNLLSAIHSDTTASSPPARGSIITAQGASPTWTEYAKGTAGQILGGDGTDSKWFSPGMGISTTYTASTIEFNPFETAYAFGREDFLGTPSQWQKVNVAGTGTLAQLSGETNHPGIVRIGTGTSANDATTYDLATGNGLLPFPDLNAVTYSTRIIYRPSVITDATHWIGTFDSTNGPSNRFWGIVISGKSGGSCGITCNTGACTVGNITIVAKEGATIACVDTTVAASTTSWYTVRDRSTSAGTHLISYAVDGGAFSAETSATPAAATSYRYTFGAYCKNEGTTPTKTGDFDFAAYRINGLSR